LRRHLSDMGRLSDLSRHKIVLEYQRHRNVAAAAGSVGVKWDTAIKWVQRFKEPGGVQRKGGSGRKPRLSKAAAQAAHELLLSGEVNGAQQVANELHKAGHTTGDSAASRATVTRHAKAYGVACLSGASVVSQRSSCPLPPRPSGWRSVWPTSKGNGGLS
jgi:transposase